MGVETVEFSVNTFVLLMLKNPEVQARAQEEIDLYLKEHSRDIPILADRHEPGLAGMEALMWEVLR